MLERKGYGTAQGSLRASREAMIARVLGCRTTSK